MSNEANAIVWTQIVTPDGFVLSVTSRDGGDPKTSYVRVRNFLDEHEDLIPFVKDSNRFVYDNPPAPPSGNETELDAARREAKEKGLVDTAKDLGGVEYLGLKPGKLERIAEGQSYDVMADNVKVSDDGNWANFYFGDTNAAGHYVGNKIGKGTFKKIFGFDAPGAGSAMNIPATMLHIVGVKGKKTDEVYQNIKEAKQQ